MEAPGVLVVAETRSLGRAIAERLESEGLRVRMVEEQPDGFALRELVAEYPVVVVATNAPYCATGRQWLRGEFPAPELIVVGCRDPLVREARGVEAIPLPIPTDWLLRAVLARTRPRALGTSRPPERTTPGSDGPTSEPSAREPDELERTGSRSDVSPNVAVPPLDLRGP